MSEAALRIGVIIGSTREGRFGPVVGRWFVMQATQRDDMTLDVIDLADIALPSVYPKRPTRAVQALVSRLDRPMRT